MKPKIISIGFALPEISMSQTDIWLALGYTSPRTLRIFQNAGIERRQAWIDPARLPHMSWQELCEEYYNGALELSKRAVVKCLDGRLTDNIGSICFASTTGFACPAMSYEIAAALELPAHAHHSDDVGSGCQGAGPAMRTGWNETLIRTSPSLVISTEICTSTYFPGPEHDLELVVANSLFADAAAACLIGYDDDPLHPEVVDFVSEFNPLYKDYLGYRWVDGRLRVILDRRVPDAAPALVVPAVKRLLERNQMSLGDIQHFIVHPGGPKVLDNIRDALGLSEEMMWLSREGLRRWGNCSSATIGLIGKLLRETTPHGWCLVVTLGAGFATVGILLYFGGAHD